MKDRIPVYDEPIRRTFPIDGSPSRSFQNTPNGPVYLDNHIAMCDDGDQVIKDRRLFGEVDHPKKTSLALDTFLHREQCFREGKPISLDLKLDFSQGLKINTEPLSPEDIVSNWLHGDFNHNQHPPMMGKICSVEIEKGIDDESTE